MEDPYVSGRIDSDIILVSVREVYILVDLVHPLLIVNIVEFLDVDADLIAFITPRKCALKELLILF